MYKFWDIVVGKVCNFISLYWSPSQSHEVFETFADNLKLNLDTNGNKNPYLIVIRGDFKAKSSNWHKTIYECPKFKTIISQFRLRQLIQEPTHNLSNSSSFIDLVFTSQPNLVMESRVHSSYVIHEYSSLNENCHNQLIYTKFNLKMWYPPPYEREIWHYQHANIDQIERAIEQFPWEKSSRNLRINKIVYLFSKTIKNIISNYIPHKIITCDDKDPSWIHNKNKQLILKINRT